MSHHAPYCVDDLISLRYWKQINETRDIYGQEVHIVHSSEFRQVPCLFIHVLMTVYRSKTKNCCHFQFAFVYECIREGESCSGIKNEYSILFFFMINNEVFDVTGIAEQLQSTCEMRPGWANMLHIKLSTLESNGAPLWGYVAVPHHCACRIYPRVNPFVI